VTRVRLPMPLEDLHTEQPDVYGQLEAAVLNLERHYKDAQVRSKVQQAASVLFLNSYLRLVHNSLALKAH
jgi:hypothetical protein